MIFNMFIYEIYIKHFHDKCHISDRFPAAKIHVAEFRTYPFLIEND